MGLLSSHCSALILGTGQELCQLRLHTYCNFWYLRAYCVCIGINVSALLPSSLYFLSPGVFQLSSNSVSRHMLALFVQMCVCVCLQMD